MDGRPDPARTRPLAAFAVPNFRRFVAGQPIRQVSTILLFEKLVERRAGRNFARGKRGGAAKRGRRICVLCRGGACGEMAVRSGFWFAAEQFRGAHAEVGDAAVGVQRYEGLAHGRQLKVLPLRDA